jgi:hypothetical protein
MVLDPDEATANANLIRRGEIFRPGKAPPE